MRRGTNVGAIYVKATVDGDGLNEGIVDGVEEAAPGVHRAGRKHADEYSDGFFERLRRNLGPALNEMFDRSSKGAGKHLGSRLGVDVAESMEERISDTDIGASMEESLRRAEPGIHRAAGRHSTEYSDTFIGRLRATLPGLVAEVIDKSDVSGRHRAIPTPTGPGKHRDGGGSPLFGEDIDADRLSKIFGRGSRNNFLNVFGAVLGNVAQMAEVATDKLAMFAKEGSRLQMFLKGAGPAVIAVVVALSMMVSAIGASVGVLTALASTIVTAVIGSLAVLSGAILSVVVAGGLLTAAFMSMTDAQQKMAKTSFAPLRDEMIGIGQIVITQMLPAFNQMSANLQQALLLLAPVAHVLGDAFRDVGVQLTAAFSGPGFQKLSAAFTSELPLIIRNLGGALGEFLNGFTAMFAVIMPYVTEFTSNLRRAATTFNEWANSAKGQNAIADFIGKAMASLDALWGFLKQVGGFIGDVLFSDEAMAAGLEIFDRMTAKIGEWRDAVAQAAENGDLARWFEDAVEFGSAFWSVIEGIWDVFTALYNSGVLESVTTLFEGIGTTFSAVGTILGPLIDLLGVALPTAMFAVIGPLEAIAGSVIAIGEAVEWVGGKLGMGDGTNFSGTKGAFGKIGDQFLGQFAGTPLGRGNKKDRIDFDALMSKIKKGFNTEGKGFDLKKLIGSGKSARLATTDKDAPYKNPYEDFANKLIKDTDSVAARLKKALSDMSEKITDAIRDGAKSTDVTALRESLLNTAEDIKSTAQDSVNNAQQALNSAAGSLASAGSAKAAKAAMKKVKDAQRDLEAALKNQKKIDSIAKYLAAKQRTSSEGRVQRLLKGLGDQNATLADYAIARNRVAAKLDAANQKLEDAIALRDQFKDNVIQATQQFGSLLTTQGQILGGIEQAITAQDITANLTDRLAKIRKFQEDLRTLTAQGLNASAYQQIVEAGVEQGSGIAQALLNGGLTAINQTNSLVDQINQASTSLGSEASSRMYQAGVDAAKGLVAGLTSLSAQLDNAATRLGNTIAAALRRALGIRSPSRVMIAQMGYVGDGIVDGLDAQQSKVASAADALARQITVSPEAASQAARTGTADTVSGNQQPLIGELNVHTPTEDPMAVAHEVVNEVVGRL